MNLSHFKGSIIILRIFFPTSLSFFFRKIIYWFISFSFSQSISSCSPHGRGTQSHYCTAIPKTLKLLFFSDYLNIPASAPPVFACLCKLAIQKPSLCLFFFPKKNRRFLLQYLVGNSKKRGTARVSHRHNVRNPTSQRTSVFSSSDRKEKKLHTRVHVTFSFLQCQLANC